MTTGFFQSYFYYDLFAKIKFEKLLCGIGIQSLSGGVSKWLWQIIKHKSQCRYISPIPDVGIVQDGGFANRYIFM